MSTKPQDRSDVFASSYFSFIQTAHWVEIRLKSVLHPIGLTHAQLNILYILKKAGTKPLTATQIKKQLIVPSPDLTRMMDRLVHKGWVSRKACPSNRRQVEHKITAKGASTFRKAHFESRRAVKDFFADSLSELEAIRLNKMMQKIRS